MYDYLTTGWIQKGFENSFWETVADQRACKFFKSNFDPHYGGYYE